MKIARSAPVVARESEAGSPPVSRRAFSASVAPIPERRATIRDQVAAAVFGSVAGKSRLRSSSGYQAATDQAVRLRVKLTARTSSIGKTATARRGWSPAARGTGSCRCPSP